MSLDRDITSSGISQDTYETFRSEALRQPSPTTSKVESLAKAKASKLESLSGLTSRDLNKSSSSQVDGYNEWDGNKIYNEYSPAELQYLQGRAYNEFGVFDSPTGLTTKDSQGSLVPFDGGQDDVSTLYGYGTRGSDDVVKSGVWNKNSNPDERYTSKTQPSNPNLDYYDNTVGPDGVDLTDRDMRLLYPKGVASLLEGLQHGNKFVMANRANRDAVGSYDDEAYREFKEAFGTGSTEAYKGGWVGAFGGDSRDSAEFDKEKVWSDFVAKYGLEGLRPQEQPRSGLKEALLQRESGGDYKAVNTLGYLGGYQFGAEALVDVGLVDPRIIKDYPTDAPDSTTRNEQRKARNAALSNPDYWTGKDGVTSVSTYLASKIAQDNAFDELSQRNYNALVKSGVINTDTPPEDVQGYLAAAHLGGASGVVKGMGGSDAYGTSMQDYFELGRNASVQGRIEPQNRGKKTLEDYQLEVDRYEAEQRKRDASKAGEFGQILSAGVAAVGTGAVDLIDAMQELATYVPQVTYNAATGKDIDIDLINDDDKEKLLDNLNVAVGYFKELDDKTQEDVKLLLEASGINLFDPDTWDKFGDKESVAKLGEAALEYLSNPSLTVYSIGQLLGSGLALGGTAKLGSKILDTISPKIADTVDSALKSDYSKISEEIKLLRAAGDTDKAESLEAARTKLQTAAHYLRGTTYINADFAVRVNSSITEYKENNNDESPDLGKLASILLVDKTLATAEVLRTKNALGLDGRLTDMAKDGLKAATVKALKHIGSSVPKEMLQEGLDAIGQVINAKYDSAEYGDMSVYELLKANSDDILSSILAGGAGGLHMAGAGAAGNTLSGGLKKTSGLLRNNRFHDLKENRFNKEPVTSTQEDVVEDVTNDDGVDQASQSTSEDPIVSDVATGGLDIEPREYSKQEALTALSRLKVDVLSDGGGTTERNLETTLKDIMTVRRSLTTMKEGSDIQKHFQGVYDTAVDSVEGFVKTNPNVRLSKNTLIRMGLDSNVLGSEAEGEYDTATRAKVAEELMHVLLGSGRTYDKEFQDLIKTFAKTNDVPAKRIDEVIKSYAAVEQEATTDDRGYVARGKRINAARLSGDKAALAKEDKELRSFYKSTLAAKANIQLGIKAAEATEASLNNRPTPEKPRTVQVTTPYKKADGTPYKINVMFNKKSKKWVADTKDIKKRLDAKNATLKGIAEAGRKLKGSTPKTSVKGVTTAKPNTDAVEQSVVIDSWDSPEVTKAKRVKKKPTESVTVESWDVSESSKDKARKAKAALLNDMIERRSIIRAGVDNEGELLSRSRLQELNTELNNMVTEAVKDSEDTTLAEIKTFVFLDEKIDKRVKANLSERKSGKSTPVYNTQAIQVLADKKLEADILKDKDINKFLATWKTLSEDSRLTGKALTKELKKTAKRIGLEITPGSVVDKLLKEDAIAIGKPHMWENVYKTPSGDVKYALTKKKSTAKTLEKFFATKPKGTKPLIFRKVESDATKYLQRNQPTVLNTIPVEYLPTDIQIVADTALEMFNKVIPLPAEGELSDDPKNRLEGNLNLQTSPARGLMFKKDGTPAKEVILAMRLAVMDSISTDKRSLMKGYKPKKDIAAMFGIQEFEVRQSLSSFSATVGTYKKTLATNVGKATMKLLGISDKRSEDVGDGSYSRFIADVGNTALLVAREEGLVEFVNKNSDDLAAMLKGEDKSDKPGKATTTFVNIPSKKEKVEGSSYRREVVSPEVETVIEQIRDITDVLPAVRTKEIWPSLEKPTEASIEKLLSKVRNDKVGQTIPKEAQRTITTMSNTPFTFDVGRVEGFLDLLKDNKDSIMKTLGYVDIDSVEFNQLTFTMKETQEAKNDALIDSIQYLERFLVSNKFKAKDGKVTMFFDFSYVSNGRYHLDSNTINPQGDKLHRFLVLPSGLETTYKVEGSNFTADGQDLNYQVRAAIGQAFGFDIEKESTEDVIRYGNVMLSLSSEQITELKKQIVETGVGSVVVTNGKHTETYEVKADHFTHTLQALDFLADAKTGKVTSSLAAEFDSMTSGFANKTQQMPILGEGSDAVMHEHFARVGIRTQETISREEDDVETLDSYKNLARKTLIKLRVAIANDPEVTTGMFEGLAGVLPGGSDLLGSGTIEVDKAMRALFKQPFMIFNYSASIGSIVATQAEEIADGVFDKIAKADLTDDTDAGTVAAKYLISVYGKGIKLTTVEELQEAIRTKPVNVIGRGKHNLHKTLTTFAKNTYGKYTGEVFEDEFYKYAAVQDVTNDAFKIMFRIFDAKRIKLLEEVAKKGWITREDRQSVTDELWKDFPYIVGPLSESGTLKDIIPVLDKVTGSPDVILESGKPPQSITKDGSTVKVRPLEISMGEARSAGSVLPYHFIDGAEISMMMKGFIDSLGAENTALLAIHDAVIVPLKDADKAQFEYNKGMYETNKGYSIIEELHKKFASISMYESLYDDLSAEGLKVATDKKGRYDGTSFEEALNILQARVQSHSNIVKKARDKWYNRGPLETAEYRNMPGTPGGVFKPGMVEPDTSYKSIFKDQYHNVEGVTTSPTQVTALKTDAVAVSNTSPGSLNEALKQTKKECK